MQVPHDKSWYGAPVADVDDWAMEDADDLRTVGQNIAKLRGIAGLKQAELATAMRAAGATHWHQNTVSRIENGKQRIAIRDLRPLSGILGEGVLEGTVLSEMMSDIGGAVKRYYSSVLPADGSLQRAAQLASEAVRQRMISTRLDTIEGTLDGVEESLTTAREALAELRRLHEDYGDGIDQED